MTEFRLNSASGADARGPPMAEGMSSAPSSRRPRAWRALPPSSLPLAVAAPAHAAAGPARRATVVGQLVQAWPEAADGRRARAAEPAELGAARDG